MPPGSGRAGQPHTQHPLPSPASTCPAHELLVPVQPSAAGMLNHHLMAACGKPVGLIQVLAGRYPCVSELLPARTRLGGCQARAGRGPLRSAGTSRPLPRAQTWCSKSGTSEKSSPALWGLQLYPFSMLQLQGEQHRAPKLSQFPSLARRGSQAVRFPFSLAKGSCFFSQEGLEKHGKETKRVA